MHLKSLELSGFKSFAKKTILDFNTSITAIVGPNGSGKSNVAEAFSFVLGEQSLKSLRGKKGEDMIFNGGSKSGKMNRASVKLIFDNTKRMLNVDFPEVSLERVVHRDGINEYSINGTQVRLRDIVELLAGAHIGSTGHHIISQGEADKILNSNMRERRDMLEDALGLKIYQYKKAESFKKLEKTKENVKSVESLRRELAPHLNFLKKQVEKVEKAREMKEELQTLAREYFKREDIYIKGTRKDIEIARREPVRELSKLDAELASAKETFSRSKNESSRSRELLEIEEKLSGLRRVRDDRGRVLGRIEGEILGLKKNIERLKLALSQDENKTVYLKDVLEMEKSMGVLASEAEAESEMGALKTILHKLMTLVRDFIQKNRGRSDTKEIKEAENEIAVLEIDKSKVDEEIEAGKGNESLLQDAYLHLKTEIENEKRGGFEAEKEILKIMGRQQELNSKLMQLKDAEERLNMEESNFKVELSEVGILAGREAVDYRDFIVKDSGGAGVSEENMRIENRQGQLDRKKVVERIKIRLEEFGGNNDEVLKEYGETEERDKFLERELIDLEKSADSLRTLIDELELKLDVEFKEGVLKVNEKFQEFFALMFGGGSATLRVVKEERRKRKSALDELEGMEETIEDEEEEEMKEGIDIEVNLPGKRIKGLQMLSGGERALTSIALLFSMSQVNPPPFIILDETDAALDEANSRKYGDMVENLSKYSQLILITHNRETMSRAGILYGVTMGSDSVSKLLSIAFDEAVKVAK
ncbi:MAG: AAA family ATPase [Candidatus Taylorbacteria bacterium]